MWLQEARGAPCRATSPGTAPFVPLARLLPGARHGESWAERAGGSLRVLQFGVEVN